MIDKRKAMKNPCYKCTRRKVGCHSTCPEYQEFREARNEYLEATRYTTAKPGHIWITGKSKKIW